MPQFVHGTALCQSGLDGGQLLRQGHVVGLGIAVMVPKFRAIHTTGIGHVNGPGRDGAVYRPGRCLALLNALGLGLGSIAAGLALSAEIVLDALLLAGGLHFLLHGLEYLRVPALLPGQSGVIGAGESCIFILSLGQLRLRAVPGLDALKGPGGGVVPVLPGVPLLWLNEILVPVSIVLALVERPLPQLGLVGVDLRVFQRVALVSMVALVGYGVKNLHICIGHGLSAGVTEQGPVFQQVFVEADGVPARVPAAVAAVPQWSDLHGLGRTALLVGKVVFKRLDRLALSIIVQRAPVLGGEEVVKLGTVGGELLRGGVAHAGVVKG